MVNKPLAFQSLVTKRSWGLKVSGAVAPSALDKTYEFLQTLPLHSLENWVLISHGKGFGSMDDLINIDIQRNPDFTIEYPQTKDLIFSLHFFKSIPI